ncbi:DUF1572 family protein [Aquiflexum gelatinilyticum]|uniref:DUF1572 family protein n=1 Tax=Aquiflexum gelatinilyticum TaxID=2961943 RepID=A0A9X2PAU8_9BACT|nr:DUF1572 family protein [Aquiflexum gelatinilyticum]MCR9015295.1 DUF1572 family protein [Aquiflexum gelatinilyticum]
MKDVLIQLFERDLKKLISELEAYKDEKNIWEVSGIITNSAGTLALHLVGNLNHFIGAVMGNTGYIRNREAEFSLRNIPRAQLIVQVLETIEVINETMSGFGENNFSSNYPLEVFGKPMTYEYFMMHLQGHLNYHLGQVNYHRRLLDN